MLVVRRNILSILAFFLFLSPPDVLSSVPCVAWKWCLECPPPNAGKWALRPQPICPHLDATAMNPIVSVLDVKEKKRNHDL